MWRPGWRACERRSKRRCSKALGGRTDQTDRADRRRGCRDRRSNDRSEATMIQQAPLEVSALGALAERFPTVDAAAARIAYLQAVLGLPKGVVHVISDVHGDDRKLRHVLNNASGSLRPLVDELFGQRLDMDGK